jgi:arabinose-5-phosphate isomerase|tara:strand:- start:47330 stop:48301 length:972 start_codon:yes stop_codon:yes gene_type:complete
MGKKEINGLSQSILESISSQLLDVSKRVDGDIQKAAKLIINHPGKLVVCGLGKSGLIGQKIVATLCSTGTQSVYMHAAEAIHGDLGIYNPGDPTILISKSGNTEEIVKLIPILKEFKSPIIAIVGNIDSFIAKNADIILNGTVKKEIDPLGVVPTTSSLVALAIGDALASVLMVERGFGKEDFARNHPGGELGKELALRVESIMFSVANVAQISDSDSISTCAEKMTEKPLGVAIYLESNKLKGILTEGDLRKSIALSNDLQKSIKQFINFNPISILPSTSIVDAMKIMEDRESQISCLPIIDSNGVCKGLLTLHALYQTKLV